MLVESADALRGTQNSLLKVGRTFRVLDLPFADLELAGAKLAFVELLRVFADRRVAFFHYALYDRTDDLFQFLGRPAAFALPEELFQGLFSLYDLHEFKWKIIF